MAEPKYRRERPRRGRSRELRAIYKAIGRRKLARLIAEGKIRPLPLGKPKHPRRQAA